MMLNIYKYYMNISTMNATQAEQTAVSMKLILTKALKQLGENEWTWMQQADSFQEKKISQ